MVKILMSLAFFSFCTGCGGQPVPGKKEEDERRRKNLAEGYIWRKLVDSAPWSKSYNFQMFSIRDTLWTFHPDGCWVSTNGTDWNRSTLTNVIDNQAFLDYVDWDGAVFGLGHFEGNFETYTFRPEICRSTNMKTWDILALNSNLPARYFYHPFVFQHKIWLIGGENSRGKFGDIWNSADGIHWNLQKKEAAFGPRSGSRVVELKGKLYLLNNDVWVSVDGLNWERLTGEIFPGVEIFGYEPVVLDEKIWLLGCNRNGQFSRQVLVSSDGKNWTELSAPWSPRGGIAAVARGGKIYMTGGKYGGTTAEPDFRYSNDVWVLEKN